MSESSSFWQRVTGMFRGAGTNGDSPFAETHDVEDAQSEGADKSLDLASYTKPRSWWGRRQLRQAQQRQATMRVSELAGAMEEHFHQQNERAAELTRALERVGGVLEQLSDTQRAQGDYLRRIAEQVEVAGRNTANLSDTVSRVPESLLSQAEAIRTVAHQIENSNQTDVQIMESMQNFGRAVENLGGSSSAQLDALRRLSDAQSGQQNAIQDMMREQGRRFLAITGVAVAAALAGLSALVITLVWQLGPQ